MTIELETDRGAVLVLRALVLRWHKVQVRLARRMHEFDDLIAPQARASGCHRQGRREPIGAADVS